MPFPRMPEDATQGWGWWSPSGYVCGNGGVVDSIACSSGVNKNGVFCGRCICLLHSLKYYRMPGGNLLKWNELLYLRWVVVIFRCVGVFPIFIHRDDILCGFDDSLLSEWQCVDN